MKRSGNNGQLNNTAGVTLIELIIVVAIISVLTGVTILGSSFLFNSRVKKAYSDFQTSYSEARANTMSKKTATNLTISFEDKTYYIQVGSNEKEKLITRPTEIKYKTCNATGQQGQVKDLTTSITISFDRATGGMRYIKEGSVATTEYLSELYIGNMTMYFTPDSGKYSNDKKGE